MNRLAGFTSGLQFGDRFGRSDACATATYEQKRVDADPPTSFDVDTGFNEELYQAIQSQMRWTGSELTFGRRATVLTQGRHGTLGVSEAMDASQFSQANMNAVGPLWAIPSTDDSEIPVNDPCAEAIVPPFSSSVSPRMWGNKPITVSIKLGRTPRDMQVKKLFQGVSLQMSNQGDTPVTGTVGAVDEAIKYANIPLCFSLEPYAGFTRGQIVRQMAGILGIPVGHVPIGRLVTKPILLSNASFLAFVNEFGLVENWYARFDEDGLLQVDVIDMADRPDWTLDAKLGGYDYNQIKEEPPSSPAASIYVTAKFPGAEGQELTLYDLEETFEFYNPLRKKVVAGMPNVARSGDGQFRMFDVSRFMLVERIRTQTRLVNGVVLEKLKIRESFFNPQAAVPGDEPDKCDPGTDWEDGDDSCTNYDDFYGDRTGRVLGVEELMETERVHNLFTLDEFQTIEAERTTMMRWYVPKSAGRRKGFTLEGECRIVTFDDNCEFTGLAKTVNDGHFAYPFPRPSQWGTTPTEEYQVVERVTKNYTYDQSNGTLIGTDELTETIMSPESRSSIFVQPSVPDRVVQPGQDGGAVPPPPAPPPPPIPGGLQVSSTLGIWGTKSGPEALRVCGTGVRTPYCLAGGSWKEDQFPAIYDKQRSKLFMKVQWSDPSILPFDVTVIGHMTTDNRNPVDLTVSDEIFRTSTVFRQFTPTEAEFSVGRNQQASIKQERPIFNGRFLYIQAVTSGFESAVVKYDLEAYDWSNPNGLLPNLAASSPYGQSPLPDQSVIIVPVACVQEWDSTFWTDCDEILH